jgi:phenylacetate-CoA ligase
MKFPVEQIYRHLPVWAQNAGISLYGIPYRRERLGGVFDKTVAEFHERDRWTASQMRDFVEDNLREMLLRAFKESPYYSQKWRSAGLVRKELERMTLSNLCKIPLTPKRDLVGNPNLFVLQSAAKRNLHRYYSSGSTGTPVTVIVSSEDHQRFTAAREARSFGWAGTSVRRPRAMIGGRMVVPRADSQPPFYRYNRAERQVYFSAFHISARTVNNYLDGFHRYRPEVMTGYAHSYYTLARLMQEAGLRLEYVSAALILGSEKQTPHMKSVIERAFRAHPYEEYGAVENCVLATECEAGSLHINPDFGIVEILDENDVPVPKGSAGRIVCTGMLSRTQPLIRYDIGDVGSLSTTPCPCGRDQLPVLRELLGRIQDLVIGRDGRQMVEFLGLFINLPHVLEGQVIQERLDLVRLRLVAKSGFNGREEALIRRRLEERLGKMHIEVECVKEIERTQQGKFPAVISRIKPTLTPE